MFLFLLPVFFTRVRIRTYVRLGYTRSIIRERVIPVVVVIFSGGKKASGVLSIVMSGTYTGRGIRIRFAMPLFSFINFHVCIKDLMNGNKNRESADRTVAHGCPIMNVARASVNVNMFSFVSFRAQVRLFLGVLKWFFVVGVGIIF